MHIIIVVPFHTPTHRRRRRLALCDGGRTVMKKKGSGRSGQLSRTHVSRPATSKTFLCWRIPGGTVSKRQFVQVSQCRDGGLGQRYGFLGSQRHVVRFIYPHL